MQSVKYGTQTPRAKKMHSQKSLSCQRYQMKHCLESISYDCFIIKQSLKKIKKIKLKKIKLNHPDKVTKRYIIR